MPRYQKMRPFGRLRPRRAYVLRVEDIRPVIRIAHRQEGSLQIDARIIFDHEFVLILDGQGELVMDDARVAFARNDLLFIPPFVPHAFVSPPAAGGAHLAVHFDFSPSTPPGCGSSRRRPYEVKLTHHHAVPVKTPLATGHRTAQAFEEILREQAGGEALGKLAAATTLSTVLIDLLRRAKRTWTGHGSGRDAALQRNRVRTERVMAFVACHLATRLDATALAAVAGVSVSRLNALFRQFSGYSPLDYLRRARVEEARRLLAQVDLSIKEVAARTGFEDAYHFSKVFRRMDGLSPAHYRAALLAERKQTKTEGKRTSHQIVGTSIVGSLQGR